MEVTLTIKYFDHVEKITLTMEVTLIMETTLTIKNYSDN